MKAPVKKEAGGGESRKNGPESKLLDPLLERGAPPGREVLIPRPSAARPPAETHCPSWQSQQLRGTTPLLPSLPTLPSLSLPSTPTLLLPQLWAARPSPPASWSSLLRWF
uniref:Macaca fascicularis brain cDNA, clone: QflA-10286 n=1 Tax=Macaca fascicularis TaxID=9541 RepID=Q9BE33_MACFA|nr:hypothetical protein [Macaca fascicularis]BAE88591.1 unnamed protein product [Macaca fascicularis]